MTKYLLNRLLRGLVSVVIVVTIVMLLVYTLMDRELIFAKDSMISKKSNNDRVIYKYAQWEKYGYLDYETYAEYLGALQKSGESTKIHVRRRSRLAEKRRTIPT